LKLSVAFGVNLVKVLEPRKLVPGAPKAVPAPPNTGEPPNR
jgi:hypothetical protein